VSSFRRVARGAASVLLLGAVAVGTTGWAPVAGQESDPFAPDDSVESVPVTASLLQYGWWNKAQQSPAGGNPTPAPPGAPADGLFILYEPTAAPPAAVTGPLGAVPTAPDPADVRPVGPEAFGAVRYSVPVGAETTLTLHYTPTSTTQPGGVNPDVGDLFACPVSTSWDAVQNGRYDSAPKYDCGNGVQAVVAGDTVSFTLPAALSGEGLLDLAIVPAGNRPFRLALDAPTDQSVSLDSVPEQEGEAEFDAGSFEDPALFEDPAFFEDSSTFGVEDFGSLSVDGFATDDLGSTFTPTDAVPTGSVARVPRGQVAVPAGVANPFRPDAGRGERLMAVALLALRAAALWWVGGQPVRAPRLLGSLGAGAATALEHADARRGIGRFSRIRTGTRPPRLF
jgi:hypothetical protein